MAIKLIAQPLTANGFADFGEVIGIENKKPLLINRGFAQKYANLIDIDSQAFEGKTALHLYLAKKRAPLLNIDMLEQHPHFSQAFMPRGNLPFVVVVAPKSVQPKALDIKAFVSNGKQGVNYYPGTWHFPLIALADNQMFIVIDRQEKTHHKKPSADFNACIEVDMDETVTLTLDNLDQMAIKQ